MPEKYEIERLKLHILLNNKWSKGWFTFSYTLELVIFGILFISSGRRIFTKFSSAFQVALSFCVERVGVISPTEV